MKNTMSRAVKFLPLVLAVLVLLFAPLRGKGQSSARVFYVVTAVDTTQSLLQESVFSNEVALTPTSAQHTVALTWGASPTATVTGYNVYRGTVSGGPYAKINPTLVSGLAYSDVLTPPNPPTALAGATK